MMITLSSDRAILVIDPTDGGRIASMVIDGYELLRDEKFNTEQSIFGYGSFPMAPYAGRIRHGKFEFDGISYQLENLADPPHALHGTAIYQSWNIDQQSDTACQISTDIAAGWPFCGSLNQSFQLDSDKITMTISLTAIDRMPGWVGFHPWFRKEINSEKIQLTADFSQMYVRDNEKVATKTIAPPKPLPWDDCFIGVEPNIKLRWGDLLELKLFSNFPYWVIYSAPNDALCIEPQSAPPNAIELGKHQILEPGESVTLEFQIWF
jgi:aldose 1-epimerase